MVTDNDKFLPLSTESGLRSVDLTVENLANALEAIRRAAWIHWLGGAFNPEHMHGIAAYAAQALCGEPIEPLEPLDKIWKEAGERAAEIEKLFEEEDNDSSGTDRKPEGT